MIEVEHLTKHYGQVVGIEEAKDLVARGRFQACILIPSGAGKAMAERNDSTSALSGFKFPVAIVHGEADQLIPVERAQEMKAAIPHAALMKLSGVGHMPMMEDPQATATTLKKLL